MENSFFFDCTSFKPEATYTPDEVVSTSLFSYYLGCGVRFTRVRVFHIHSWISLKKNQLEHSLKNNQLEH
jgi:hypothetical protein